MCMGFMRLHWTQIRCYAKFYCRPPKEVVNAALAPAIILTTPGMGTDRPVYTRLLPSNSESKYPCRIEHLAVQKKGAIGSIISTVLSLPIDYVVDLVEFGAVHHALRCPEPPSHAPPKQRELFQRNSPKKWPYVEGMTLKAARSTNRVLSPNDVAEPGSYIRVHVHPKRFSRCYMVDWKSRIIANTDSFVVLNKPAGVSVGGCVDNMQENCAVFTAKALDLKTPLLPTHQIDNSTEGCLVLAKNSEFSSKFHGMLRDKSVGKYYRALSTGPVPLGLIEHQIRKERYPPHIVSKEERSGWYPCLMEILECEEVPWPTRELMSEYKIDNCGWKPSAYAFDCKIKLITGYTHQIRVQFAALGAPLLGDTLYMPAVIARSRDEKLDPFLNKQSPKDDKEGAAEKKQELKWIAAHGSEPELTVGLQSCEITWQQDDKKLQFNAGPPWWR